MMQGVTSACKLAKEPLTAVAVQKICAASQYDQIGLVSGKTSSGVKNIPAIERCNIKWLAANAGPALKGESKEYEMQGGFL